MRDEVKSNIATANAQMTKRFNERITPLDLSVGDYTEESTDHGRKPQYRGSYILNQIHSSHRVKLRATDSKKEEF